LYRRSTGYFATAAPRLAGTSPASAQALQAVLAKHCVPVGRLLDVGCATGQLLYHMGKAGWEGVGVEINPDAAEIARDNGVDVRVGDLDSAALPPGEFDAVNLGDVLEHVRSPLDLLVSVRRLLRPGGVVVIRTPNAACGFARVTLPLARLGFPWPHAEAPYHLFEFTPRALRLLMQRAQLHVAEVSTHGHRRLAYVVGATGFFDALKSRVKTSSLSRSIGSLLLAAPGLAGVTALLAPFHAAGRAFDCLARTGESVLAVARKNESEGAV
jgi:SAM-dependent methyltransferase